MARYEWKPLSSDTLRRASDEDSDFPTFWIQSLDGSWRSTPGGAEAVREMLKLAAGLADLRAGLTAEHVPGEVLEAIRAGERARIRRELLAALDTCKDAAYPGLVLLGVRAALDRICPEED